MVVKKTDALKWLVVALLVVGGVTASYYYAAQPFALRMIAWLVLACACAVILAFTEQGQSFLAFAQNARVELLKVHWPSRQETVQTTIVVVVMVAVSGFLLWGLDILLLWGIGILTGQRG